METHKKHSCSGLREAEGWRVWPATGFAGLPRAQPACAPHLTLHPGPWLLLSPEFLNETVKWLKKKRLVFIKREMAAEVGRGSWGERTAKDPIRGWPKCWFSRLPSQCGRPPAAQLTSTPFSFLRNRVPVPMWDHSMPGSKATNHIPQAPLQTRATWGHPPH